MFFYELSWYDLNDSLQKKDGFASFFLTFEAARQIKDEFGVKHFGVKLLQVLESDEIRCIENCVLSFDENLETLNEQD